MIAKLKLSTLSINWRLLSLLAAGGLLGFGIGARITGLMAASVWYDEAFSLNMTRRGILEMVRLITSDFTPPLWELVFWLPAQLGGLLGQRLAALSFGLLAIWLAYRLTQALTFSTGQTVCSLVLIALLPGLIWTSQDGRSYALFSALYLAAMLFAIRGKRLGLIACCGLLVYANPAGPVYASAAVVLYAFCQGDWRKSNAILFWLALASLPWASIYLSNLSGSYWLDAFSLGGFAYSLVGAFFIGAQIGTPGAVLAVLLLAICILAAAVLAWRERKPLLIAALLPMLLMVGFSIFQRNVVYYRPLIPSVIPLVLLFCRELTPHRLSRFSWILPYSWAFLLVIALLTWSPAARGGGLEQAAQQIRAAWQPGDVIYYGNGTVALPAQEYLGDLPAFSLDEPGQGSLFDNELGLTLGMRFAELGELSYRRAWILYPRDANMPAWSARRLDHYTAGATLVKTLHYPQFPTVEIYLEEK